jgi:ABC-type multidrug transport system permease subunit
MALIIFIVFSQGFSGLCYGLFIAALFDGIETILQVTLASFYPILLMSGVIWPIEAQPKWLMFFSQLSPVTYAAKGLRDIIEKGWGLTDFTVYRGFIAIYIWTILFSVVFIYIFSSRSTKLKTLC